MARAFTPADVVQHDSGTTPTSVPNVTASLPNPATEGNGGIMIVGFNAPATPPENWHIAATPAGTQTCIMCRADLAAGDQSWVFDSSGADTTFMWIAEEWTNLSYCPLAASSGFTTTLSAPTSISAGTTGSFDAPYVQGLAFVFVTNVSGTAAWPTVAWDNSFAGTDEIAIGDGTGTLHIKLYVARRTGTLNETGPWSTTATFTGSMTGKTAQGAIAVFRAEETQDMVV
jgi:hypothetical protein